MFKPYFVEKQCNYLK